MWRQKDGREIVQGGPQSQKRVMNNKNSKLSMKNEQRGTLLGGARKEKKTARFMTRRKPKKGREKNYNLTPAKVVLLLFSLLRIAGKSGGQFPC